MSVGGFFNFGLLGAEAAAGGAPPGSSAQAQAFLARTAGLDALHTNAYGTLIDGLVADGVWSKLDVLHVYATKDSTTAKLNLISSSYPALTNGSPTFTADRGFTGAMGSTTVYIDTQFNPVTASSPNFTQNSAHISAWCVTHVTNSGTGGCNIGQVTSGQTTVIFTRYQEQNPGTVLRVTDNGSNASLTDADGLGHYIATRSNSATAQGYKNGSQIQSISDASTTPVNCTLFVMAYHDIGLGAVSGSGSQHACASIGSALSSTDATNFYNRLRTFMTAVGVP